MGKEWDYAALAENQASAEVCLKHGSKDEAHHQGRYRIAKLGDQECDNTKQQDHENIEGTVICPYCTDGTHTQDAGKQDMLGYIQQFDKALEK